MFSANRWCPKLADSDNRNLLIGNQTHSAYDADNVDKEIRSGQLWRSDTGGLREQV